MPSTNSAAKSPKPAKKSTSFRVGRVRAYLRGRVWYLCYHEHGQRRQPRVGPDKEAARQLAAEINAQLKVGALSASNQSRFQQSGSAGSTITSTFDVRRCTRSAATVRQRNVC